MAISKDMYISEVLEQYQSTVPIFFKNGLHCLGCVMASGETVEEACMVHGIDCDQLLKELNEFLEKEENAKKEG